MKATYKKVFLTIIALIISGINASLMAQGFEKGLKYIELNQLKQAKKYFKDILKKNPGDIKAMLHMGDVYFLTGSLDSASLYYNKGIETNPSDAYNYIGLSKVMMKKGNTAESKANIEKAMKIIRNSKDAGFYLYLAEAYYLNGNYETAMQHLDKARSINKNLPEIYVMRGNVLMAMGLNKAGDAANEYDRALFFNRNYTKAYFEIGKLYVLAWNYDEALKAFQDVIKQDSNYIPVYKELGELYYRANKNTLAANAYAKYISMAEVTPADIGRYAQMLYFSNNFQKSSEFIDRYLKTDSNNFVLLRILGYNSYELGEYEKGVKAMKKMFSLANDDNKPIISDYEYLAKLYNKTGNDTLAVANYLTAIQMDSAKSGYLEDIAKMFEKSNKYNRAAEYYEKYLQKKSPTANDYFQLGKTCYIVISDPSNPIDTLSKRQFANKADSAFIKLIKLLPDQYLGYLYRARVNSVMDPDVEKGLAKPFYEETLKIIENDTEKYKREIIEAYEYLGFYYFMKKDYNTSETYWKKILAIDSENAKAKGAVEGIKKMRMKVKQ